MPDLWKGCGDTLPTENHLSSMFCSGFVANIKGRSCQVESLLEGAIHDISRKKVEGTESGLH